MFFGGVLARPNFPRGASDVFPVHELEQPWLIRLNGAISFNSKTFDSFIVTGGSTVEGFGSFFHSVDRRTFLFESYLLDKINQFRPTFVIQNHPVFRSTSGVLKPPPVALSVVLWYPSLKKLFILSCWCCRSLVNIRNVIKVTKVGNTGVQG